METSTGQADRAGERDAMIARQLAQRGIASADVLDAIRRVPREWFVPKEACSDAYADNALRIDCSQTISQPYMVARMTELIEPAADQRVLEIGTGSGYQTAILALLVGRVFSIEWHLRLLTAAAARLNRLKIRNVALRCGDGSLGWEARAPFDAILTTAGAPDVPAALCDQLLVGGRLVIPIGPANEQTLVRVRRTRIGFASEEIMKCRFVKLVGAAGWQE